ncbi:MAG TPA: PfkB family carbohydrate kinase [Gemmatimonadaceae bacterium]|nr:PfkB family carbohydrate kinase [Gemmatimonadaceae bacterium]
MTRIVCFGELMLRLSPPGAERFFQSPALRAWFGGSEANVAVGLVHLGTPASYITRLPANAVGDAALAALRAEGVDTRDVLRGGPRMGIYYVESGADLRPMRVVYDRAGSAFSQIDADAARSRRCSASSRLTEPATISFWRPRARCTSGWAALASPSRGARYTARRGTGGAPPCSMAHRVRCIPADGMT